MNAVDSCKVSNMWVGKVVTEEFVFKGSQVHFYINFSKILTWLPHLDFLPFFL